MIRFESDYLEGALPEVMEALVRTTLEQTPGYGEDAHCARAAQLIREKCAAPEAAVHFLVGGTQANMTVIAAALRPHQAAVAAATVHIAVHETVAGEATGHMVISLPSPDGKISAGQVRDCVEAHWADSTHEHQPQPALGYISQLTDYGTVYSLAELEAMSAVCREKGLLLFGDGARMGAALASSDVTLPDLARLTDVFYIGGTKLGARFGEAVVITNDDLKPDFRYCLKQHGGMLAKGRLLGEQFLALLDGEDGSGSSLYFTMAKKADEQALRIRAAFEAKGCKVLHDSPTNQQFFVLPDEWYDKLAETYAMTHMGKPDKPHTAVRVCTSWATKDEAVEQLIQDVATL